MSTTKTTTTKTTTKAKPVNAALEQAKKDNAMRQANAAKNAANKAAKATAAAKEAESKANPAAQWLALFVLCLNGALGQAVKGFYASAITHHAAEGTRFPRKNKSTADPAAFASAASAAKWLAARANTMRPGDGTSLAIFDRLVVSAFPSGTITKGTNASTVLSMARK